MSGRRAVAALALALPALAVAVGGWAHRWTNEDAFINFRVVEQVVAGNGPVFNAGERVEAYTSPLWLGVLVVVRVTAGLVVSMPYAVLAAGLAVSVAAFALGAAPARGLHPDAIPVPLGLGVVAAVPVVWDFATSGLEVGASWLWLAAAWATLAAIASAPDPPVGRRRVAAFALLGLGPLVRPDLGLAAVVLLATATALVRPTPRRLLADAGVAAALPLAYQVFRMGYFGSLVPSTALAKDAGGVHLDQGVHYLRDLSRPYDLWLPLLIVAVVLVAALRARPPRLALATAGMVGAGVAHAAYIVTVGGDYMHGRLLLPALFAVVLPASVGIPRARLAGVVPRLLPAAAVVMVAVWGLVCAGSRRYENPPSAFPIQPVADYRQWAPRPLVEPLEAPSTWYSGADVKRLYDAGRRGTIRVIGDRVEPGDPDRLVWVLGSIGLAAYNAGIEVHVVDIGGLAEPLAARTDAGPDRPAGHRKSVDDNWYAARLGVPAFKPDPQRRAAAARALRCEPLADLLDAIEKPMTPSRFMRNLAASVGLTRLHVPADPFEGERELCR